MILGRLKNFIPIGPKNAGRIGDCMHNFHPIRGDIELISEPDGRGEIERHGHSIIHDQHSRLNGSGEELKGFFE